MTIYLLPVSLLECSFKFKVLELVADIFIDYVTISMNKTAVKYKYQRLGTEFSFSLVYNGIWSSSLLYSTKQTTAKGVQKPVLIFTSPSPTICLDFWGGKNKIKMKGLQGDRNFTCGLSMELPILCRPERFT